MKNEPVRISALLAGLLVAVSTALLAIDGGATWQFAVGQALAYLGLIVGGGEVARSQAWGPKTVDEVMDAEAVISAAERGEHG